MQLHSKKSAKVLFFRLQKGESTKNGAFGPVETGTHPPDNSSQKVVGALSRK
jgi:hypothetical protein